MFARLRPLILAMTELAAASSSAPAAERYFVLIFGSQSHPKHLRDTHTWATFVRAVGEGPDPNGWALYVHTISWLPATLDVHVWRPYPEAGVNLDVYQTLAFVLGRGQRASLWGPFEVGPPVYEKSLRVLGIIHTGAPQYRAISTSADLLISDCIHAVAAVDPLFGRNHYPLIRIGNPASRFIAREVMVRSLETRGFDQAAFDHSWLIPRLWLDRYPITVVPPRVIPARRCVLCRIPE
jgi:hypothetical protein